MSHWYSLDGTLHTQVANASKGGMRDTTMKDARKHGWLPSVTTVLQLLNRPGLNEWRVRQAAWHGMLYGQQMVQFPDTSYIKDVVAEADKVVEAAADFGTDFHAAVAHWLGGRDYIGRLDTMSILEGFIEWYNNHDIQCLMAECSFASEEYGYAGTIDFIGTWNDRPVLVDFKTQEGPATFYDEYPLQLVAYSLGIGEPDLTRISVVVDRVTPGRISVHEYPDNEGDARKWLAVWECWKEMHSWNK